MCATLLIASYIAIGAFGVFGMHTQGDMNMQGHDMPQSNCVGATATGVDCPKQANLIDFANFHINAFRGFSVAIFGQNILASILVLVTWIAGIGLGALLASYLSLSQPHLAYSRYRLKQLSLSPQDQLLRWLSLHENSPASP